MNCIYCHKPTRQFSNLYYCYDCYVGYDYIIGILQFKTYIDDVLYVVQVDLELENIYLYEISAQIFEYKTLHWIFPQTVNDFVRRALNLMVFS